MHLSPYAPHAPAYYPDRHANMFSETPLPKSRSFNEKDVSDKPRWVRSKPLLSSSRVQDTAQFYRKLDTPLQPQSEAKRDQGLCG
jgi:N-acetylglucosamine-6-sulfatase